MSHSFHEEPELTYEQAKQALYRALELQAERESSSGSAEGVTREQLAQMAAELGVKPEYVREATNELLDAAVKPAAWHVDPKSGFDHWVDRPLEEEDWVQIGRRIQPFLQTLGYWDRDKLVARWVGPYQLKLTLMGVSQRSRAKLTVDPSLDVGLGCGLASITVLWLVVIGGSISDHDVASIVVVGAAFLIYVAVAGGFKFRANRQRRRRIQQISSALAEYFDQARG